VSESTVSESPRTATAQHRAAAAEDETPSVARAATWVAGTSTAGCLLLLLVAAVAGADLEVLRSDGRAVQVTPTSVVVSVMFSVLAGTVLLGLVGRRSRRAWTGVEVLGLVLGLASLAAPLTSSAAPATTAVLVAMHAVCAVVWFTVLTALLRRTR
jgi:hypothetical protein